ncbi:CRISPR-associated helicase/endonuclease Cas3 [Clostridium tyrobutyricum]|uniref:CRISPR-associated helicase Cas3 n=1 Tax=Clostridium tyrobutyricum DIVETGP TaxID=1408889 RepID=W6NM44_CLOTY|nr:CRISPR-associated helicase/endonuclease Cas3 [Clostridium tyrobutyricum]AND85777.1 hypothetical protein CTK_C25330 [Clostridium tyrobutyricum]ANP70294.1 CRISPR-associated helicase/endonuclease Cas3 [Clostridium tyrobutyricum]MBR9648013.1 CRISPR-associated helicase/endonuclease Cas3 [Clostridium tyrobutyricum]MBV4434790.1 CRISPR-associated helicase/endonuclease Cas3 [Clostridium tyrobutyricum]MBV4450827.1 CRISPR-associated helicase/endonuclease Cas3 [Clostridium tyrobutyricum]
MYFDGIKLFDFETNVENISNMYAHRDRDDKNRREKLLKHINLTYKYMKFICREKNLDNILNNLQNKILTKKDKKVISVWKEMMVNTVYMHDVGKINPSFQYNKMLNEFYEDNSDGESKHSLLGSYIYVSYFNNRIKEIEFDKTDKFYLKYFMYLNSYIISKHHGYLDDMEDYELKLNNFQEDYSKDEYYPDLNIITSRKSVICNSFNNSKEYMDEYTVNNSKLNFYIYIYSKFIFSLLTASDYYATSEFMNGEKVSDLGIISKDLKQRFANHIKNYKIFKSIENYKNNPVIDENYDNINQLRSEITIESERNYLANKDKNIYYLEAPTGGGKTLTSVNIAKLILESHENINKLFYIFPFNTLVEQTEVEFMKIFNNDNYIKKNIAIINSITPIKTEDKDEDYNNVLNLDTKKKIDYNKALLNRIFINYPFVITTHVNLFNSFFGTSREELFPLINLCNSVIILDEIQSYRNSIWKEIINFLSLYSEVLNIKFVIMSATLPRLSELLNNNNDDFVYLIKNRDHYFKNILFKNRVKFEMIDLGNDIDEQFRNLLEDVMKESKKNNKILLEFIFKKTADRFFSYVSKEGFLKEYGHEIAIITSDDNKLDRNKVIKKAKEKNKKIIIIATQIIEAGVDIDMDLGYKNISILDAEEQFMGRINRSCLNTGKVKFFKINDCSRLYSGDVRKEKELTLEKEEVQILLKEKDFKKYYGKVLNRIQKNKKEFNDNGYAAFVNKIKKNSFSQLKKYMELISDDNQIKYNIFLSRKLKNEKGEIIDGNKIWEEFKALLMDNKMDYCEKKVKLSIINSKVNYFIYRVNKIPEIYNDDILGNIYYISDGEKYVKDGRFNHESFIGETPDIANLFI